VICRDHSLWCKYTGVRLFPSTVKKNDGSVPSQPQLNAVQQCGLGLQQLTFNCDDNAWTSRDPTLVPHCLCQGIADNLHRGLNRGHLGHCSAKKLLQKRFFWSGWSLNVKLAKQHCHQCARYQRPRQHPQRDNVTMTLSAALEIPNLFLLSEPAQIRSINLSCLTVWKTLQSLSKQLNYSILWVTGVLWFCIICSCFNVLMF